MSKRLLTLMAVIFTFLSMSGKLPEYQIEGNGTGSQGTYLIKVSVLGKDKNVNDDMLARCAVHGVLFRGFSSKEGRQHQKPLAGSPAAEAKNADYFESFFGEGGAARNYVEFVSGSRQVVKSGKQWKVTSTVTVNKEQLRKDLEQAGVISGLNSAF